jgi:diguanylate cyclase (GGDEF)-like protein
MPDMDGLTLCRTIRSATYDGYIYIILLTVQDEDDAILDGLNAGADEYLSKRAPAAHLVARLRTAQRILTLEKTLRVALAEKGRLATTDVLTGANNRRYFDRHLAREFKRAQRYREPLSLLLLDIDHFKSVNDRWGHATGDDVLREFAHRIGTALPRATDWYARVGGEEFAVVLPHTSIEGARAVAEKLRRTVCAGPVHTGTGLVDITVSIGVSGFEALAQDDENSDAMVESADRCLYLAKESGRNRVYAALAPA